MFGYILPDKPNMYMKDYALYKAFYCGMCKSIKCEQGQLMRLSVNYDVTFINILLHGIMDQKIEFSTEACILNPFKKKCILKTNPVSLNCVYLNALLADFKCRDDLDDKPSHAKRFLRGSFKGKTKRAKEKLPEVSALLDKCYIEQMEAEKNDGDFELSSSPFANCMREVFKVLTGDKYIAEIGELAFYLGKYVYLLDAVDDFESDVKDGQFNPFKKSFPECKTKEELITNHYKELEEVLNQILFEIKENYDNIPVFETESIITNTLWFGLGSRAKQIFSKENKKCQKTHTKF